MQRLEAEIDSIRQNDYRLKFRVPTDAELTHIRQIHRDLTESEHARVEAAEQGFRTFLEALRRGDMSVENLPLDLRTEFAKVYSEQFEDRSDDADEDNW